MNKDYSNWSDEQIIEKARQVLPLPSEVVGNDFCIIPFYHSTSLPPYLSKEEKPSAELKIINVVFMKEFVAGVAIGWKFDRLSR